MAAFVFADHGMAMALPEPAAVSPVLVNGDMPAIRLEALVRRSDI